MMITNYWDRAQNDDGGRGHTNNSRRNHAPFMHTHKGALSSLVCVLLFFFIFFFSNSNVRCAINNVMPIICDMSFVASIINFVSSLSFILSSVIVFIIIIFVVALVVVCLTTLSLSLWVEFSMSCHGGHKWRSKDSNIQLKVDCHWLWIEHPIKGWLPLVVNWSSNEDKRLARWSLTWNGENMFCLLPSVTSAWQKGTCKTILAIQHWPKLQQQKFCDQLANSSSLVC